ncbi:MAG: SDR family oxidoreductase [Lutibacter sp.]|nr:SDR family oxidoreductase [Lutibacter sp.]MDP3313215.1 SDR family oxidoreductase [Lutibacter sp.]
MKIDLTTKNVLIGGSTQGLGKAIALQMAECGATVTLMARNEGKLSQTLKELNIQQNQKHKYLVVDFYDFEAFQNTLSTYFLTNKVDILVNNTNGPDAGGALEKTIEDYQKAFDLLFKTTCFATMLAIEQMKLTNYGRIINATSISVKEPLAHLVLSNTIRAAVVAWAKTLSSAVAPYGITVNNIFTGIFDTERIQQLNEFQAIKNNITPEEQLAQLINQIPMKRLGEPKEFGFLASFLASNAASYITGANIPIDGGFLKSI